MKTIFSYVYAIQHNKTKRIYIGTSTKPEERYRNHISLLKNKKHKVEAMQESIPVMEAVLHLNIKLNMSGCEN